MPLTLELPPEVEARLVEEAAKRGLPVSDVVTLLVQGYFWSSDSSLIEDWYREESRRAVRALKRQQAEIRLRERLVEAVTRQKNLQAQIAHEERAIARCESESVLAAQKHERAESLKAFQTKVLHEQRHDELKCQLPDATAKAEKLRAELLDHEQAVSTSIVEAMRMTLQRVRTDVLLGKPAVQHSVKFELETKIRNYASESVWNVQYEEWIGRHQEDIPEEVPSEVEVMQRQGEQTQQVLDNLLKRLEELHSQTSSPKEKVSE